MLIIFLACARPEPAGRPDPVLESAAGPHVPVHPSGAPWTGNPPSPEPGGGIVTTETAPVLSPSVQLEDGIEPGPVGMDLAAELFDDDVVPTFDLELSEDAADALRDEPYVYVEGALVYAGVRFEPVGIRLKGQNSFLPFDEKPSIKVKLNAYVQGMDLLDLEELTFDNMSSDATMMRERLSYRLFREYGLPAARANHAVLRINGEERGLYTLVESVDEELLALRYPDPTGAMWEMADVDFDDADVAGFEPESGSEDRSSLQAIADALEVLPALRYAAAEPWVDWDEVVDFTAATVVVGQFDSYPWRTPGDDAHVYFDPADGRMDLLPHGMDETFHNAAHPIVHPPGLLLAACTASPACADDYVASVWDVEATAEAFGLLAYAEDVQAQIDPYVQDDPRRPYTVGEVEDAQVQLLDFVEHRADTLSDQLGGP